MPLRALLVLLVVMNLSVALWWATGGPRMPAADSAVAATGVPRLRLLSEVSAADAATVPAARCHRVGPYADPALLEDALGTATEMLAPGAAGDLRVVTVPGPRPERWRVAAPPPADGDSAALSTRIAAAGFDDQMIVAEGPEAGTVALGRFSTPEAAARRQASLQAAGFDAQVHPVGGESTWLHVPLAPGADPAALRARLRALQAQPVACLAPGSAGRAR